MRQTQRSVLRAQGTDVPFDSLADGLLERALACTDGVNGRHTGRQVGATRWSRGLRSAHPPVPRGNDDA